MKRISSTTIAFAAFFFVLFDAGSAMAFTVSAGSLRTDIAPSDFKSFFSVSSKLLQWSTRRAEIENISSCTDPIACDPFVSQKNRETALVISVQQPNDVVIGRYVDTLLTKLDHPAQSAVFGETPDKTPVVITAAQNGQKVDREKTIRAIRDAIATGSDNVDLQVDVTEPADSADLGSLGIHELIAEATTNFRGSPKNRIFNINRALEQFQSVLIAPGAEFSFVKQLGEVDGEHGYLPELVIKENKTEPEFGGGICQVSTTMFRTAINAGLKITARRNHAYPVSYYKPYGMDATVYVPKPDLTFVNNTQGHILILSSVEGNTLTFRFYGTNDGRKVEIDGPHILESNPDGSMKTTFTQKVTDAAGAVMVNDTFPSNYKSPSLFPHPQDFTVKPPEWSKKQWDEYLAAKAVISTPKPTATQAPAPTGN